MSLPEPIQIVNPDLVPVAFSAPAAADARASYPR